MPRINILDRQTAELIAAGEVIERPSSVVKELVENAIDSGASAITVEIQSGGIKTIRVTDNGCGINREDIPKAFLRHATSKVLTSDDLAKIGTLGFRGEALASICAVAKVELLTRTREEKIGSRYRIQGGEGVGDGDKIQEAGCPLGTTIIVRDLFYNVPARMKFLKKDSTEGNAVATLMDRLALSHPEISFQLLREGQRKLHTPGDGRLLSAVFGVYGGEFGNSLIPVGDRPGETEGPVGGIIKVTGYITRPEGAKATRSMEHFFINHRYVKSGTMMAALEEAYKNSLMTGKFPGCVLELDLPLEMVDVNVHPAKLEVKLSEEGLVFDAVYNACKGALSALGTATMARDTGKVYQNKVSYFALKNPPIEGEQQRMTAREYRKAISLDTDGKAPPFQDLWQFSPQATVRGNGKNLIMRDDSAGAAALYQQSLLKKKPSQSTGAAEAAAGHGKGTAALSPSPELGQEAHSALEGTQPSPAPKQGAEPRAPRKLPDGTVSDGRIVEGAGASGVTGTSGKDSPRNPREVIQDRESPSAAVSAPAPPEPLRLIGEAFGTYILAESGGMLCLIDKHAAHERLLFEELKADYRKGEIPRQLLRTSARVSLPKDLYGAVMQNPEAVSQAGFGVEDFGDGSVLVREIPAVLPIAQVEDAILEMAEMLKKHYTRLDLNFFDELFHSVACKAAVKGNRFSQKAEQQELLDRLAEHPGIRNCPHGRPVMIVMTQREIEKMFGRIV